MLRLVFAVLILSSSPATAGGQTYLDVSREGAANLLEVSPENTADLDALFTTLESYLDDGLPRNDPVVVILHGEEALPFTSHGYHSNRMLIDRAARLDAYRLIDVRMCETWMSDNGIDAGEIPAFVETVPYAPEEIERLEAEGFVPYRGLDI